MQQATALPAGRLEIAKSPRRIIAGFVCILLFALLCGGGLMLGNSNTKLLVISACLTLFCVPVSIMFASHMLRVMAASNPALTFERDGLRLNFAGAAFIPYQQIERVTGGDLPLVSTIGLRLLPGSSIPRLGFGMKLPGRNIPLICLFAMPARRIIEELERRITMAARPGAAPRPEVQFVPSINNLRINRLSYWVGLPGVILFYFLLRDKGWSISLPWFAIYLVAAGRLRDIGRRGAWALCVLCFPILIAIFRHQPVIAGGLVVAMMAAFITLGYWPGTRGPNRFGPPLDGLLGWTPLRRKPAPDNATPAPEQAPPLVPVQRPPVVEEMQRRDSGFSLRSSERAAFGTRDMLAARAAIEGRPPKPVYTDTRRQSRAGIASLAMALAGALLALASTILAFSQIAHKETVTDAAKVQLGVGVVGAVLLLAAAMVLGVIGLVRKNRKRACAAAGLLIAVIPALLFGKVIWDGLHR